MKTKALIFLFALLINQTQAMPTGGIIAGLVITSALSPWSWFKEGKTIQDQLEDPNLSEETKKHLIDKLVTEIESQEQKLEAEASKVFDKIELDLETQSKTLKEITQKQSDLLVNKALFSNKIYKDGIITNGLTVKSALSIQHYCDNPNMAQDGFDNRLKAIFDNKEHPDYIPEGQQSVAAQFILKNIKNRNIDENATIYLKDIAQERLVGDGDEKFVFIE